jgi:hypothetical protein
LPPENKLSHGDIAAQHNIFLLSLRKAINYGLSSNGQALFSQGTARQGDAFRAVAREQGPSSGSYREVKKWD